MDAIRLKGWQTVVLVLGFGFFYLPIAWIIGFSFMGDLSALGEGRVSLHWYRALMDNDQLQSAAYRSLYLALLSSAIATVLGTLAGISLARIPAFFGRGLLIALMAVPIFAPEVLLGFSFLMLFAGLQSLVGWPHGKDLATLVIAHATLGTPIVASVVFARVAGRDHALEDAARDLGARPWRVLRTITIPLAAPGIVSGGLLATTLSFDDIVTSSFLAGPENSTLPMAIFSSLHVGLDPQINAVGTLMLAAVSTLVMGSLAIIASRNRRARSAM
jgi:putrescine transport system permease protein